MHYTISTDWNNLETAELVLFLVLHLSGIKSKSEFLFLYPFTFLFCLRIGDDLTVYPIQMGNGNFLIFSINKLSMF